MDRFFYAPPLEDRRLKLKLLQTEIKQAQSSKAGEEFVALKIEDCSHFHNCALELVDQIIACSFYPPSSLFKSEILHLFISMPFPANQSHFSISKLKECRDILVPAREISMPFVDGSVVQNPSKNFMPPCSLPYLF